MDLKPILRKLFSIVLKYMLSNKFNFKIRENIIQRYILKKKHLLVNYITIFVIIIINLK